jgi:hypothetical protein
MFDKKEEKKKRARALQRKNVLRKKALENKG